MSATPFLKMHGLGNDFLVFDARAEPVELAPRQIRALSDRREGVGFDQLVIISPPSKAGAASIRFWNADGGETGACGNATRCVAMLLMDESGKNDVALDGPAGPLACMRIDGSVTVDMGAPRFGWEEIPLAERMDTRVLDLRMGPVDNPILIGPSAVNLGNPHCIFFVDRPEAFDLARIGPMIENHPLFPERANVSLARVMGVDADGASLIRLRVWERGTGLTRACGTAACAACVAAARKGLASRRASVQLDGGVLHVEWRESDNHVLLSGPCVLSYRGELDLAAYGA